jgi:peptidyl-dipeptidase A
VYDKYIDGDLPWSLRRPSHSLTTEGIAMLLGGLTRDLEWLQEVMQLEEDEAQRYAEDGSDRERAGKLVFTRWSLVMTNFERGMYADPERSLDDLWWDLVERYQKLPRPDRMAPDWAAKFHIALEPVYYHNYELGSLVAAQAKEHMARQFGGIVGRKEAGAWLRERFFWPGAGEEWGAHIKFATGEALNPRYFIDAVR